jgi:prepilin-type N-terminal cleavage/methylation domain-containing protein
MRIRNRQGYTLIELSVVMAIFTVAVMFFTQVMLASRRLDPITEEAQIAGEALRTQLEEMRAQPFDQLVALFGSKTFDVPGLSPAPGETHVGRIEMPLIDGALREDVVKAAWSMPRDLNNDGVIDSENRADDALILPVTVRAEWSSKTGSKGRRALIMHSMFARL